MAQTAATFRYASGDGGYGDGGGTGAFQAGILGDLNAVNEGVREDGYVGVQLHGHVGADGV